MKNTIREPNVSGSFYNSSPDILNTQIENFLTNLPRPNPNQLNSRGFIAPHAGHLYSGQTAAYVYKIIAVLKPSTVIILGPSHFTYFNGISIDRSTDYQTPLGLASINTDLAIKIAQRSRCEQYTPEAHLKEHNLEVHIPFIQVAAPGTQIVPIMIGNLTDLEITETIHILEEILRSTPGTVIVASSDMSHFHPYNTAVEMDQRAIKSMVNFDVSTLINDYTAKKIEMCGFIPALITMMVMENLGYNNAIELKYSNSGDITGDLQSVVGYGAICFSKSIYSDEQLNDQEKTYLLKLARKSIMDHLGLPTEPLPAIQSELIRQKRGAFVTLQKHGRLRGCIGYIQPVKSIHQSIQDMAVAAAFKDSRFSPLESHEISDLEIDISILSPIEEVEDINHIIVGKHGLIIKQGQNSGLLLPQVPVEWEWDRDEFLGQTCQKAGLTPDAWKKGAQIFSFTATVFGEEPS